MHGARFHANGQLALGHALGASVAFHAVAFRAVDARRVVRAGHVAVPAADAFVLVNGNKSGFGIFVHRSRRADLGAGRMVAMVARQRCVIGERVGRPAAVAVLFPFAVAYLVYAAVPELFAQIVVVRACQLTGLAAGATLSMEEKCLLCHV